MLHAAQEPSTGLHAAQLVPSVHGAHDADLAGANVPRVQGMHGPEVPPGLYCPAAHSTQGEVAVALPYPDRQLVQPKRLASSVYPTKQAEQRPVVGAQAPHWGMDDSRHAEQVPRPTPAANRPLGHSVHPKLAEPATWMVPSLHCRQGEVADAWPNPVPHRVQVREVERT